MYAFVVLVCKASGEFVGVSQNKQHGFRFKEIKKHVNQCKWCVGLKWKSVNGAQKKRSKLNKAITTQINQAGSVSYKSPKDEM